jgi:hypothetical protein
MSLDPPSHGTHNVARVPSCDHPRKWGESKSEDSRAEGACLPLSSQSPITPILGARAVTPTYLRELGVERAWARAASSTLWRTRTHMGTHMQTHTCHMQGTHVCTWHSCAYTGTHVHTIAHMTHLVTHMLVHMYRSTHACTRVYPRTPVPYEIAILN